MKRKLLVALIAGCFVLASGSAAFSADVLGTVSDSHGDPVGGVQIEVRNVGGKPLGAGTTGSDGGYRIGGLASGTYAFVLEPRTTGFKGGSAVAHLDSNGLIVDWRVSKIGPALALAKPAKSARLARRGGNQIAGDPFGYSRGEFAGLVGLGTGAVAAGVVAGYGAAGGFSEAPVSSSR